MKLITSDAYTHKTYYMGMVDEKNQVNFYDGKIRVVDPQRQGSTRKFPAAAVPATTSAEHVEPWSYMKFCYLKPLGWKGFVDGPESSIYSVAPLARLNAADGMATPEAQKAYEEFFTTLGGKPVHHTLANHWARVIEMLYAAERMRGAGQRSGDHQHGHPRRSRPRRPTVGIGVVEAPRGTLFHHYETDENGSDHEGQPDRGHPEQRRPHRHERGEGAKGLIHRRQGHRRPAQQGRDGLPRLRPVPRLRHALAAGPDAADRLDPGRLRSGRAGNSAVTERRPRILVLGLGNDILGDDAVGLLAARRLRALLPESVDVVESRGAGLDLLDLLEGYDRALLLDAIMTGKHPPGTILEFSADDFREGRRPLPPLRRPADSHPTRRESSDIVFLHIFQIVAVEVENPYEVLEGLSKPVEASLPAVVERAERNRTRLAIRPLVRRDDVTRGPLHSPPGPTPRRSRSSLLAPVRSRPEEGTPSDRALPPQE